MTSQWLGPSLALAVMVGLFGWLCACNAQARSLRPDDPEAFAKIRTIGDVLATTTAQPVHIIFVHGMRTEGPGTSQAFLAGLCRYALSGCTAPKDGFAYVARQPLNVGEKPEAEVLGTKIWKDEADWRASQPFVDRYVFQRPGSSPVIVDEVNWWPLLFPLKCQIVVAPESRLSGVDAAHLALCHEATPPYHDWLGANYGPALERPKVSGGGALLNGMLKRQIMNWGLSDAVIALGPMRVYIRKAIEEAFTFAGSVEGREALDQEFIVVSESLGSFAVMDAAQTSPNTRSIVSESSDLYFFANQFRLLELARLSGAPPSPGLLPGEAERAGEASPLEALQAWASTAPRRRLEAIPQPKQIVAFNDPSDILTFDVPKLHAKGGEPDPIVVNVYDRNEFNWFGLFVDPTAAHTGHSRNKAVLKLLFTPRGRGAGR